MAPTRRCRAFVARQGWISYAQDSGPTSHELSPLFALMNIARPAPEHDEIMSLRTETRARASTEAPNNGGIRSRGSSPGAERNNEALRIRIRGLEQQEKDINVVIITACPICVSLIWFIVRSIQNLQVERVAQNYQDLYTAIFSHVPRTSFFTPPQVTVPPVPHAPDPALAPSGFDLLWVNVYWVTSLVFGLSTISIAVFAKVLIKQKIRDHRTVLRHHGRPLEKARMHEFLDGDAEAWFMHEATDTTYRLLQVSLVVFLLGHIDSFLFPLGATVFIPTVICGLLYAAAIRPTTS
ncbi:hypothetical protein BJY52DRAFT_1269811 [Lactarius psammicola]|nr:hypothetical protein BJY52DRAFT_1269811 [Lactarius psammicola]